MTVSLYIIFGLFFKQLSATEDYCATFDAHIPNSTHKAYIQLVDVYKSNPLNSKNVQVTIHYDNNSKTEEISKMKIELARGFLHRLPLTSSVEGFVENEIFFGTVQHNSVSYYIEAPIKKTSNCQKDFLQNNTHSDKFSNLNFNTTIYTKIQNLYASKPKGKVCTLLIIIDYSFYRDIGHKNAKTATITVLKSLDTVNSIFRSTDFDDDGIPDNIGFKVKHVIVFASVHMQAKYIPPPQKKAVDGKDFLMSLNAFPNLGEVCLAVAFTTQKLSDRGLGASFTAINEISGQQALIMGGLCERPNRIAEGNFNTMVISYYLAVIESTAQIILDLSLAHEIGHCFGSDHDDTPENNKSCNGYLMTSHSPGNTKIKRKNMVFSKCSKKQMNEVITKKGTCLIDSDDPFCGNGIIEADEECDCGISFDCDYRDTCCTSKVSSMLPCRVRKDGGRQCHPARTLCCNFDCRYINLSHLNINCKDTEKTCPCKDGIYCKCGLQGTCIKDQCQSIECTRINAMQCLDCSKASEIDGCQICCIDPALNSCVPADILTKQRLKNKEITIKSLKNYEVNKSYKFQKIQKLCFQSDCVNLSFWKSNIDDYCLYRGELGICSPNSKCATHIQRFKSQSMKLRSGVAALYCSYHKSYVFYILIYITMSLVII